MASQWNPPLPPGYEARWDPNQRAYFYINHSTKQTTWQDPRAHVGQQQHQAAANFLNQQSHQPSAGGGQNVAMTTMYKQFGSTTTRTSDSEDEDWENDADFDQLFSQTRGEEAKVDMQKLHKIKQQFPSASEDTIKALLIKHKNVEVLVTNQLYGDGYKREHVSHPPPRSGEMLERLRVMFPDANPGMVSDILVAANHDEKKARSQLQAIGYNPTFPVTHQSPARVPSPARNRSTSPPKATSPAKPKLSEAKKRELEKKIHNQFKTFELSVIQMALQVCDYEESRVKAVLDRIGDSSSASSRPSTSTSRPGTSTSYARSPSPVLTPASLEPASLFDDDTSDPFATKMASGMGRSSVSPSRPATGKSTARVPSPKKSKQSAHRGQQSAHHGQQRQKHAVRQARTVVSRQPQAFQNRTLANGPDPSLRHGPNKNLLLTDFTPAAGPNRELRQGPDPSRVQGSQGACGPDPAFHCGPQCNLAMGHGQRVMMTAI